MALHRIKVDESGVFIDGQRVLAESVLIAASGRSQPVAEVTLMLSAFVEVDLPAELEDIVITREAVLPTSG